MTRTDPEIRRIYRTGSRSSRLIRLATLAGINLGKAIYGERAGFGSVTHKVKRHSDLVMAYADEHAREAIEHAKGMVESANWSSQPVTGLTDDGGIGVLISMVERS